MKGIIHDFGGIRISVFFPGDKEKVIKVLQRHLNATVIRRHDQTKIPNETVFGGYRATHIRVKPDEVRVLKDKKTWEDVEVEIQIATLVMNVWSEIQHYMIYKPLGQDQISNHEKRLLDLINGIALTGEVALGQLEASTNDRLNQRANNDDTAASDNFELVTWMELYHRQTEKDLGQAEWKQDKQLYGILKAAGDHRRKNIYDLLDALYQDPERKAGLVSRQNLPGFMLEQFCKRKSRLTDPEPPHSPTLDPIQHLNLARDQGWRLVHGLSMAMYLGIGDRFSDTKNIANPLSQSPPSLADFLDLMHPTRPVWDGKGLAISRISDFCQAVLDNHRQDTNLRVCVDLADKGLVCRVRTSDGLFRTIFPGLLIRMFPLNCEGRSSPHHPDEWDDLHFFDSIDECVRQSDRNRICGAKELGLDEKPRQLVAERFFLPSVASSPGEEHWRLVGFPGLQDELQVKFINNWNDEYFLEKLPQGIQQLGKRSLGGVPSDQGFQSGVGTITVHTASRI